LPHETHDSAPPISSEVLPPPAATSAAKPNSKLSAAMRERLQFPQD
jgi:hypothetical protein